MAGHGKHIGAKRRDRMAFLSVEEAIEEGNLIVLETDKTSPFYEPTYKEPTSDFVDSVFAYGVVTPPLLTQRSVCGRAVWRVIAGRTRIMALRLANAKRVEEGLPPHPLNFEKRLNLSDQEVRDLRVLENNQRKVMTLADRARQAREMLKEANAVAEAEGREIEITKVTAHIAAMLATTATTATRLMRIAELSVATQKAIYTAAIPLGSVDRLLGMSADEQKTAVAAIAAKAAKGLAQGTRGANAAMSEVPSSTDEDKKPKQKRRSRKLVRELHAFAQKQESEGDETAAIVSRVLAWIQGEDTLQDLELALAASKEQAKAEADKKKAKKRAPRPGGDQKGLAGVG